jgi:hypothetical protein
MNDAVRVEGLTKTYPVRKGCPSLTALEAIVIDAPAIGKGG